MRIPESMVKLTILSDYQSAENALAQTQEKLARGKEVERPSDDPLKFVTAARFKSLVRGREQDIRSIGDARRALQDTESAVSNANELLQRLRTLFIQAGNETQTTADLRLTRAEMKQALQELIQIGNTGDVNGKIFGGAETTSDPFEVVENSDGDVTDVIYRGDTVTQNRSIGEDEDLPVNFVGSRLFQIDPQSVTSAFTVNDATASLQNEGFPAGEATGYFELQGKRVFFDTANDSMNDVAARINQEVPSVSASVTGGPPFELEITASTTEQIFALDQGDSRFLERMGITDGTSNTPANLIADQKSGDDVFDVVIKAIENLENGEFSELRGERIEEMDRALDNFGTSLADVAGRIQRINNTEERVENFVLQAKTVISANEDLDFAKAISDLRRQESKLQTAISALGNVPFTNLLNFL